MHTIPVSPTLRRLLMHCETECMADCCGARAFDITAQRISLWLQAERIDRGRELAEEIRSIRKSLDPEAGKVLLDSRDLRSEWYAQDFGHHLGFIPFWTRFEEAFTSSYEEHAKSRP